MAPDTGDGEDGEGERGDGLGSDAVFDLLAHHRRRHALACLREHGPVLPLADLSDEVAVRERGTRITEIPREDVLEVYMSLYHVHVPKLADADVVEYEQERDIVRVREDADRLARLVLEEVHELVPEERSTGT